jgi:hypothetical protein
MNNLKQLIHKVPMHTWDAKKGVMKATGWAHSTLQEHYNNPYKKMYAQDAINLRNYFRQFFPCEIDDVIVLYDEKLARKLGMVKLPDGKSPEDVHRATRRRKATA